MPNSNRKFVLFGPNIQHSKTVDIAMSEELLESESTNAASTENNEPLSEEIGCSEKSERLTRLPLARIRTLIKADQDVTIASQESVFLIAKSTELFIEQMAKEIYKVTQRQKRKTVYKKDLATVIEMLDEYAFLEGTVD